MMEGTVVISKRTRNDFEEVGDACCDTTRTAAKKPRIRWTTDLHKKFVQAIAVIIERKNPYNRFGKSNGFGELQVVPKEILEEMEKMGVKGLNRHNVSSHLQKHRSDRTTTKNKGGELLDQQQLDTNAAHPTYLSQCYYMPIMESDFSSPAVAALYQYPDVDHYHYLFHRNSAVNYPMQRPKTYVNYSGIAQQIDPLPMAQQLMIPLNQPSIWNPSGCNFDFSRAPSTCFGSQNQPITMPGPHSANCSGFSAPNDHSEFIGRGPSYVYSTDTVPSVRANCLQEPSGLSASISTGPYTTASPPSLSSIDYQSPEAASNITKGEVNFPLQNACVGPDTTTAATNDRSGTGNSEAPATLCDQDPGLLGLDGLDLFWLKNLTSTDHYFEA